MSEPLPTEWDHLHSVTMIQMEPGKWNLFAAPTGGATITFPALLPDPAEAIIVLGKLLADNESGAAIERREKDSAECTHFQLDPQGACMECGTQVSHFVTPAEPAPTPSTAQRARPARPRPRRRPKPRKR